MYSANCRIYRIFEIVLEKYSQFKTLSKVIIALNTETTTPKVVNGKKYCLSSLFSGSFSNILDSNRIKNCLTKNRVFFAIKENIKIDQ